MGSKSESKGKAITRGMSTATGRGKLKGKDKSISGSKAIAYQYKRKIPPEQRNTLERQGNRKGKTKAKAMQ